MVASQKSREIKRVSSALRARPTQARSRETFDNILTAAGELLSETGWEGFNTNALAERVGCRVATVYRYFPDKLAVISTLAERTVARWDKELLEFGESLSEEGDLRLLWSQLVNRFMEILQEQPAALAVRYAMQAEPTLRSIDQADNQRLAESVGRLLQRRLPHLSKAEANSVARTLIETTVAITDLAIASPARESRRLRQQLETMHDAYIVRLSEGKD